MEAELTLKLDDAVVLAAQRYAEKQHRSLSNLIEEYFRRLPQTQTEAGKKYPKVIEELSGVLTEEDLAAFAKDDGRVRYILTGET